MYTPDLELSTPRLKLRLPRAGDAALILDYVSRNKKFHTDTNPVASPDFYTESFWNDRIEQLRDEYHGDHSLRLYMSLHEDPSRFIGAASLSQITRGPLQACYLGYTLDCEAEGKGLMTEALKTVIAYAFDSMHLHRIMANHLPENKRSANVLARLGFRIDGSTPDYLFINGKWREHVMTSLTNPNWRPREEDRAMFEDLRTPSTN